MQFKIGDVVRLKSGGPPMTVTYVSEEYGRKLSCRWFVQGHEVRQDQFPPEALTYADNK